MCSPKWTSPGHRPSSPSGLSPLRQWLADTWQRQGGSSVGIPRCARQPGRCCDSESYVTLRQTTNKQTLQQEQITSVIVEVQVVNLCTGFKIMTQQHQSESQRDLTLYTICRSIPSSSAPGAFGQGLEPRFAVYLILYYAFQAPRTSARVHTCRKTVHSSQSARG